VYEEVYQQGTGDGVFARWTAFTWNWNPIDHCWK
jgi:hypothetical protein